MSTRAIIAQRTKRTNRRSTCRAIYLHNDGDPRWAGCILLAHYASRARVEALLELGDLSMLGPQLGQKHDFMTDYGHHVQDRSHPMYHWCLAYDRDRGNSGAEAITLPRYRDLLAALSYWGTDYLYLWAGHGWLFGAGLCRLRTLRPLNILSILSTLSVEGCPLVPDEPLIVADWLEEHGDGPMAEHIRAIWRAPRDEPSPAPPAGRFEGLRVYPRAGSLAAQAGDQGVVTGTSRCRLEGCTGRRLHVRWADNRRTYPCSKGCKHDPDGSLRLA